MRKEGILPSWREVGDGGWRAHASATEEAGSARQRREAGARAGLRASPRRGARGPFGRAEGEGGQRPHGPAGARGAVGWLGQNQGMRKEQICKFIFKRF
jgi:hypothetical protein